MKYTCNDSESTFRLCWKMYPSYIKQAGIEGEDEARGSFGWANKMEQIHHGPFQAAADMLEKGRAIVEKPFYVCQYYGNTVEGETLERCPVCGRPKAMFKRIE